MANYKVDLNCDMGESFGTYILGNDEAILNFVTSANIACGFHAGDPSVMKKTVKLALQKGVAIGAHPGLPDLAGFGRRTMSISPEEAYDITVYQVGALAAFVKAEGAKLHHVKPHGALYNMAATNEALAEAITEAIYKIHPEAILYGLAGSKLISAGEKAGLQTAHEVFADRTYQQDGTLTPRSLPNALIHDQQDALEQVVLMIKKKKVISLQNNEVSIQADTVCIHGDGPYALEFVRAIKKKLLEEGISIETI